MKLDLDIKHSVIRIGYQAVGIFDHRRSKSIWDVEGNIVFKGKAFIGHGSKISVGKNAAIIFGNNFAVTAEMSIVASEKKIEFGDNCLLSWDILLLDSDFHKVFDKNEKLANLPKDILIRHNVWIGCRTTILKGRVIPNGVVIVSNYLVLGVMAEGKCIYGRIPLKLLKSDIRWKI